MKVNGKFSPVTVTLETQDEVDRLYAIFNHVELSRFLGSTSSFSLFSPYVSEDSVTRDLHAKLVRLMTEYK